ncbi:reverse transcriptase domain-containing protein [Trichonephila clavipes]|nr:reverse transcriptase domain-containing protein [Trichonephila clavipes]
MLLGYADASESAYGAVVYMHSVKEDGTPTTKLISSKSRVAPIKFISIHRLELSVCLLLAQLVKRTVGDARLTLEQFITITTQIESILNSRPLTAMSSDPNDFAVLTPGHFLIGRTLQSLPEPDMTDKLDNSLSEWQKLTFRGRLVDNATKKNSSLKDGADEKMPKRKRGLTTEEIQKLLIELEDEIFDDSDSDCKLENEEDLDQSIN